MSLRDEIKQTKPFASPLEEATLNIIRTAEVLRYAAIEIFRPYGITGTQYNVLRILRGAGPEGLPTLAVRDRLVEEAPGITRLIDKLERAKLVQRDRTGRDRRTVRVQITPAGIDLLERADGAVKQVQVRLQQGLSDEGEQRRLVALLAQVRTELT